MWCKFGHATPHNWEVRNFRSPPCGGLHSRSSQVGARRGARAANLPTPNQNRHLSLTVLMCLVCLTSGLDCLICGLDCLVCGLDCLVCDLDCLVCGLDCLVWCLDCLICYTLRSAGTARGGGANPLTLHPTQRAFLIDNLLVRIHHII